MTGVSIVDEEQVDRRRRRNARVGIAIIVTIIVLILFAFYVSNLTANPPGFYVDESAIAYNAYCIAQTGKNEFGTRLPLIFPVYTDGWTQYANPTQIYLLAIPFAIMRPSIGLARVYAASWVFAACLLLGVLAWQISRQKNIGVVVALFAIFTPWLFEVSRLVMETFFYPMALVLFLMAVYAVRNKEEWGWINVGLIALSLASLTYSYTIGRLLGPLLAGGLILFTTSQSRLVSIIRTWAVYAATLIPLFVFRSHNPGALTQRFYLVSYIKPDSSGRQMLAMFIRRYLGDLSLISLLFDGDANPRHHVPGALGSFLIAVFILALMGLVIVLVRYSHDVWWRFIIFGAAASIVPGALTTDQFHSLRLVAYPIFLLLLTVPALIFLSRAKPALDDFIQDQPLTPSYRSRQIVFFVLIAGAGLQAVYFQSVYQREGFKRYNAFDAGYKEVYDAAIAQTNRPIYLIDVDEPAYAHAFWYATIEGRNRQEFIHLDDFYPPPGSIVIASAPDCTDCEIILKSGDFILYRSF